ncbi:hypothetical protein JTB14_034080 [Gonioctena quinquepunctata]|nr:hypothetical protein JTB14_034080 [Gonioctena quinquepunctata]
MVRALFFAKASEDKKVLSLMDDTTHTNLFEVITLDRENEIIMLSLSAHTTHRLQTCDVSFFKPITSYYNQVADKWLRVHPSQNFTWFQVSELLGKAYAKAASVGKSVSRFAKCSIWPLYRNVFDDS